MSSLKSSATSPTIRRILKEAAELSNSPSADFMAAPLESDLFEWHFTFRGPPNSPYADGIYHGRIVLPPTYPLRPPSFRFSTPSGRFEVNREICLSISGHHEETWQPAWGVRTALVALRSFMESDPRGQLGGLETTDDIRKRHAQASHAYKCPVCARSNIDIIRDCEEAVKEGQSSVEVEVPSELKMGWKDEMGRSDGGASTTGAASSAANDDKEAAELAEAFVQTTPPTETGQAPVPPPGDLNRVGQAAPTTRRPTPTVPLPALPRAQPAHHLPLATDDGVPVWVDRAIVIVVVVLIAMILKAMLSD